MEPAPNENQDDASAVQQNVINADNDNSAPAPKPPTSPNSSNHFFISVDVSPTSDTGRYYQFFQNLRKALRGENIDEPGEGPSGINASSLAVLQPNASSLAVLQPNASSFAVQQPATNQRMGHLSSSQGFVPVRRDVIYSSEDDEPTRHRSVSRAVAQGHLRAQGTHDTFQVDFSSDEDPIREPGQEPPARRSAGGTVSRQADDAPPGVCCKCRTSIPTVILACMHLYCEPCVSRMAAKRRPCVRRHCRRGFRSWKSLQV